MEWRWQLLKPLFLKKGKKKKDVLVLINSWLVHNFSLWLGFITKVTEIKTVCEEEELGSKYRIDCVPHSLKRQVLCVYPPGHTLLRKKKSIGVLTLRYFLLSALPWWRYWEYAPLTLKRRRQTSSSLCSVSLRATGTCNCIAQSIRQTPSHSHTQKKSFIQWETPQYPAIHFFSQPVWMVKYRVTAQQILVSPIWNKYWEKNQWRKASYTKYQTAQIRPPLLKWVWSV